MNAFFRALVGFLVLGTGGVVLYAGSRAWQGAKPAFWDITTPARQLEAEQSRYEKLETDREIVLARNEGKQWITEEVIGRRLTLLEAAARFRGLHASSPEHSSDYVILRGCSGASEEERWCRHAIAYVEATLKDRPDREAVLARLNAELRDELKRHGTVHLSNSGRPAPPRPPTTGAVSPSAL